MHVCIYFRILRTLVLEPILIRLVLCTSIHRLLSSAWGERRARTIRKNARTKWRPLNSYVTGRAVAGIQKVGWWESPIVNRGLHSSLIQNLGRGKKQKWRQREEERKGKENGEAGTKEERQW